MAVSTITCYLEGKELCYRIFFCCVENFRGWNIKVAKQLEAQPKNGVVYIRLLFILLIKKRGKDHLKFAKKRWT